MPAKAERLMLNEFFMDGLERMKQANELVRRPQMAKIVFATPSSQKSEAWIQLNSVSEYFGQIASRWERLAEVLLLVMANEDVYETEAGVEVRPLWGCHLNIIFACLAVAFLWRVPQFPRLETCKWDGEAWERA